MSQFPTKNTPPNLLELLRAMVRFDSVNGRIAQREASERPLAEFLARVAAEWGLKAEFLPVHGDEANLLITAQPISGERPVLLLESHLDTVTVEGMKVPPFAAEVADGKVYGRGSCDTKASGACMLWALAAAHHAGELANPTALLFTIDEEVGKLGIETFVRRQLPTLGWKPALALVGEPTLLRPVTAHNGAVRWKIATRGIPAHSSNPSLGRSAISDMTHIIREIEENYIPSLNQSHALTGKAQGSINQIWGGTQANVIPDWCEIVIDRRTVPGESPDSVLAAVEKHLDAVRRRRPGIEVRQCDAFIDPALEPLEQERSLAFLKPALTAIGLSANPAGLPCGTDAANLCAVGIPAVVIGPGDLANAHTVDEWVSLDQVQMGGEFFARVLRTPLDKFF